MRLSKLEWWDYMKKYLGIMAFACLLLTPLTAFAAEDQAEYIACDDILIHSEDLNEIEPLVPEIIEYANLFTDEGVQASKSDIDFSSAYCIYVDVDIFNELPMTKQNLERLMESAAKVWAVPVRANGKTVIVQISKAPELSEIDTSIMSKDEMQEVEVRAGNWQIVASSCYDGDVNYNQQIQDTLTRNRSIGENRDCILFGGVPGVQTIIAVVLEEDVATGIISLQRDIVVDDNPKTRDVEEKFTLVQDEMYSIEEFAKYVEVLRSASDDIKSPEDDTTGALVVKETQQTVNWGVIMLLGCAILIIVGVQLWRRKAKIKN